jgi:RimJ/RimL family protein N-acetyltransferase
MKGEYPSQHESRVALENGAEVFIRPVRDTDGVLILDLFGRISPRSLYQRFLSKPDTLPDDLLYHLTHIDYDTAFALAGVVREKGRDVLIAVARYARDPQDDTTDLAIAVRDDWQNLGLGKALLTKLVAIGKERGIPRFVSMMDPQNYIIRQALKKLGYTIKYSSRSGFYEVEIIV